MNRVVSARSTLGVITRCEPAPCFTYEITETLSDHGLNRSPRDVSQPRTAQKPLALFVITSLDLVTEWQEGFILALHIF